MFLKRRAGQGSGENCVGRRGACRFDIKNEAVLELRSTGMSASGIARVLDISNDLVRRVLLGIRKDPILRPRKKFQGKRCSCCGARPVHPGNHFLCYPCFKDFDGSTSMEPEWAVRGF